MPRVDVIVIGGGIAGLAASWHLSRAGAGKVCVLEREPLLAVHASSRNAGIFRHLDEDEAGVALALRSRELLAALEATEGSILRRTGALYLGSPGRLRRMADQAERLGVRAETLPGGNIRARFPFLTGGTECGLLVTADGVLDVSRLCEAVANAARRKGTTIRTGAAVRAILQSKGQVRGVELGGGEGIRADAVVIAAGAWAGRLGATCEAELPLASYRRHLAMLLAAEALPEAPPVIWRLDEEVYLRPEPGGFLASPCDEELWPPETPPCSPEILTRLADRVARMAPRLRSARVLRAWACLRTFAPDRGLVAGADPRRTGLFWIAGLGGRGMSVGLALGEVAAAAVSGTGHVLESALSPARLCAS
jgi:glycine/D-amino acid oxidase-like deaminating enzyme